MKIQKLTALLTAAALSAAALSACRQKESSAPPAFKEHSAAKTTASQQISAVTQSEPMPTPEETVTAAAGDAFLAVADGKWLAQYWGRANDLLSYKAKTAAITRNGKYTVGVSANTVGCQFEVTNDPAGSFECSGIRFAAVEIADGAALFPELSIEITEIRVNGTPIPLTAKNNCYSADGKLLCADIYNPQSAADEPQQTDENSEESPKSKVAPIIIRPDSINAWTDIEVDFEVTGYTPAVTTTASTAASSVSTETTATEI